MSTYCFLRNEKWYYRRRIPKKYAPFFTNSRELRFSLSTKSSFDAIIKAKKVNTLYEELIMSLQIDTFDQKQQLVENYMNQMKAILTEGYFNAQSERLNPVELRLEQSRCEHSLQKGVSHIAPSQIEDVFEKADIDINSVDENTYHQVDRLYLRHKIDMLESLIRTIEPKSITHQHVIDDSPIRKLTGITFERLYELFLKEKKIDTPNLCQTTFRDYESAYRDFNYVIENAETRDIATFTKEDFRIFTNAVHNMPISRTKKPEYKNLSYAKLKELDIPETQKMATNTKKKKLSAIKQIFDMAVDPRYSYLEENLAEPFLIKESKKRAKASAKTERKPLTEDNLNKLFSSKIYTSNLQKTLTKEPHKYWIPVIALYTGMRQNEICQLYNEDIQSETIKTGETIYYFNLNEKRDDNHLKNENATRKVPIHHKLIELGFLKYYNSVKTENTRLFPQLRLHPDQNRYNTDYEKSFMKFFRTYITTEKDQVFHSLRHNVSDQLLKNAVHHRIPKDVMNSILGHEPDKDSTTQNYHHGYGISELYEGIKTLEFDAILIPS